MKVLQNTSKIIRRILLKYKKVTLLILIKDCVKFDWGIVNRLLQPNIFEKLKKCVKPSKKDFKINSACKTNVVIAATDINVKCWAIGKAREFLHFSYQITLKDDTQKFLIYTKHIIITFLTKWWSSNSKNAITNNNLKIPSLGRFNSIIANWRRRYDQDYFVGINSRFHVQLWRNLFCPNMRTRHH